MKVSKSILIASMALTMASSVPSKASQYAIQRPANIDQDAFDQFKLLLDGQKAVIRMMNSKMKGQQTKMDRLDADYFWRQLENAKTSVEVRSIVFDSLSLEFDTSLSENNIFKDLFFQQGLNAGEPEQDFKEIFAQIDNRLFEAQLELTESVLDAPVESRDGVRLMNYLIDKLREKLKEFERALEPCMSENESSEILADHLKTAGKVLMGLAISFKIIAIIAETMELVAPLALLASSFVIGGVVITVGPVIASICAGVTVIGAVLIAAHYLVHFIRKNIKEEKSESLESIKHDILSLREMSMYLVRGISDLGLVVLAVGANDSGMVGEGGIFNEPQVMNAKEAFERDAREQFAGEQHVSDDELS